MKPILSFPSENTLTSYLESHPNLQNPYVKEIKLIQIAAHYFANLSVNSSYLGLELTIMLFDLSPHHSLEEKTMQVVSTCLKKALEDCAENYPPKVMSKI